MITNQTYRTANFWKISEEKRKIDSFTNYNKVERKKEKSGSQFWLRILKTIRQYGRLMCRCSQKTSDFFWRTGEDKNLLLNEAKQSLTQKQWSVKKWCYLTIDDKLLRVEK